MLRTLPNGEVLGQGAILTEQEYSKHSPHIVTKFKHMLENEGEIPEALKTKKFAQRVVPKYWGDNGPSITATSLADDYVYFSQPRTFTVREWARLQMFPDWYQFAYVNEQPGEFVELETHVQASLIVRPQSTLKLEMQFGRFSIKGWGPPDKYSESS